MWVFTLEDAAYLIRRQSAYRGKSKASEMPQTLCVCAMLFAYAVECALKAKWLRIGQKLIQGGRYARIPNCGHHDLVELASAVGFVLSAKERNVLSRLSQFALFAGRYPIGKTPEAMRFQYDTYLRKVDVGYFAKQDFRIAQSVLNKIIW
jgi:hypothetical protein